jgi:hypothetical protein
MVIAYDTIYRLVIAYDSMCESFGLSRAMVIAYDTIYRLVIAYDRM